jgi:hypothetical protein
VWISLTDAAARLSLSRSWFVGLAEREGIAKQRGQTLHQAWAKAETVKRNELNVENVGAGTQQPLPSPSPLRLG